MTSVDRSSYGLGLTASARDKRNQQLASWNASATNREPAHVVPRRLSSRVKFSVDVIFMAAVASGDEEEVQRLLEKNGAQVNCVNSDGLTPAHQVTKERVLECHCEVHRCLGVDDESRETRWAVTSVERGTGLALICKGLGAERRFTDFVATPNYEK